jgi:acyl-CoA thioesterase FadM
MNLYIRLFFAIFRGLLLHRIALGEKISRSFRVLPNDIDINGHMNNGRYMTVVDLLLMEMLLRSKLLLPALKRGWIPAMGGNIISYRKQLKLFEKYSVSYKVCGWSEKWTFFEYEFRNTKGELVTRGYSKGAFWGRSGLIPIDVIETELNLIRPENKTPDAVEKWIEADAELNKLAS